MRFITKKRLAIACGVCAIPILIVCTGSVYLATLVAKPDGDTLAEEKSWEIDHGLWEDFDTLPQEPYEVTGEDNYVIHCAYIPAATKSDHYVIISHGFRSNRYGAVKYISVWRDLGFNCVIYDVRAHGENAASICTLGQTESRDLIAIIQDAHKRWGNNITVGLHGESMGSSISLSALAYNPDVAFVVADCSFANLYDLLEAGYKHSHLGWLTPIVNTACQLRYGFDMHDTNPEEALAKNTVPLCFIHGTDDTMIPPDNSYRLAEATAGYAEVHEVAGAAHARSREVAGKKDYEAIIASFLDKIGI